uniref:Uncharacterized protein n=1 Tax=Picea glauca TaxID=3330 RepID=A0A101M0M6_PICGL|nr:hypothetical protein ABT39_MTgene4733 [Picea glauca]
MDSMRVTMYQLSSDLCPCLKLRMNYPMYQAILKEESNWMRNSPPTGCYSLPPNEGLSSL